MGQHKSKFSLLPALRLLNTESQDEYDRLSNAIAKSIKPRDALEEIWMADIIYFEWIILRLRRGEAGAIHTALSDAARAMSFNIVENLRKILPKDKVGRAQILAEAIEHADDSTVEEEALRTSAADVERFHRILASLESRRDKSLRRLAEYRGELGRQLRDGGGRLIEGEVLELKPSVNRTDPKAA